ncbi:MAG: radical SAM protein [Stomatobaculum sp.]|nr:radical SAM protein [Stomatobaculum sp.]
MMKIALVRPLCSYDEPEFQEPLGAEAICGYLRERGLECRVFDRLLGVTTADLAGYGPDWVGFSLMTDADIADALRLVQMLRAPMRRFFAGGMFVTTEPERAAALFPKDTVLISGEGEGPVYALVTGGSAEEARRPGPDEWAFASRDDLASYLQRGGVINLRTARGCRGSCAFCTTPSRQDGTRRYEARDPAKVAEEMAALSGKGYLPVFNFTDDEFGGAERVLALEEELKRRDVRAAFTLEMRAADIVRTPRELWPVLHEGGLCRIFTGLESFNTDTLRRWNKPVDVPVLMEAVRCIENGGIACEVGYILWHEHSTADSVRRETEQLHDHGLMSPKTALSRLILYPGSRLHEMAGVKGTAQVPLTEEAQALFRRWEELLGPLSPLWTKAALLQPGMACRAWLQKDSSRYQELTACMKTIREMTYLCLTGDSQPDKDLCREIGEKLNDIISDKQPHGGIQER